MDFVSIYLMALRDKSPTVYARLLRNGQLTNHVRVKAQAALERYDELVRMNGFPESDRVGRKMLEEVVLNDMMDEVIPFSEKPGRSAAMQFEALISGARFIKVDDHDGAGIEANPPDEQASNEEFYDLDEEAAQELWEHFESTLPPTDAGELYFKSMDDAAQRWAPGVDDLEEAEASAFLKSLRNGSTMGSASVVGQALQIPSPARGPRMAFQYKAMWSRWFACPTLLEELDRTGLLATYLHALTKLANDIAEDLRVRQSLGAHDARMATDWAMDHVLDLRSDEQKRLDQAALKMAADRTAAAEEHDESMTPWVFIKRVAPWVFGMIPLSLFYLVMGEGLRALGWWSGLLGVILVVGPIIIGAVAWSLFSRWRDRFHAEAVRAALTARAASR